MAYVLFSVHLADAYKREPGRRHHSSDVFTSGEIGLVCIPECWLTEGQVNKTKNIEYSMSCNHHLGKTLSVYYAAIDVF